MGNPEHQVTCSSIQAEYLQCLVSSRLSARVSRVSGYFDCCNLLSRNYVMNAPLVLPIKFDSMLVDMKTIVNK